MPMNSARISLSRMACSGFAERRMHDHPHEQHAEGEDGEHIVVVAVRQKYHLVVASARLPTASASALAGHP